MRHGGSDHDLIAAFLRGDQAAVDDVRAAIRVVVRSFQFPARETEREVVQDVLGRLLQCLRSGQFRGEATLRTYVQQMTKYACLGHIRRQRALVRLDFDSIPSEARWSDPDAALLTEEERARGLAAFAALPGESKELLRLVFVEGLSYDQVARRLGVTEGAIKSRVHRIRLVCRDHGAPRNPPAARRPLRVER